MSQQSPSDGLPATRGVFQKGITLIELLLVIAILVIALAAILASIMGQLALSEHARNTSLALNDANRIVEQIRQENRGAGCTTPDIIPPLGASWDAWLGDATPLIGGGGKSLPPPLNEQVFVTCLSVDAAQRCATGATPQIGAQEWNFGAALPAAAQQDPMRVTVSVCWRHRGRDIGECSFNTGTSNMDASDANNNNIIDSPVSVTTLVTCR